MTDKIPSPLRQDMPHSSMRSRFFRKLFASSASKLAKNTSANGSSHGFHIRRVRRSTSEDSIMPRLGHLGDKSLTGVSRHVSREMEAADKKRISLIGNESVSHLQSLAKESPACTNTNTTATNTTDSDTNHGAANVAVNHANRNYAPQPRHIYDLSTVADSSNANFSSASRFSNDFVDHSQKSQIMTEEDARLFFESRREQRFSLIDTRDLEDQSWAVNADDNDDEFKILLVKNHTLETRLDSLEQDLGQPNPSNQLNRKMTLSPSCPLLNVDGKIDQPWATKEQLEQMAKAFPDTNRPGGVPKVDLVTHPRGDDHDRGYSLGNAAAATEETCHDPYSNIQALNYGTTAPLSYAAAVNNLVEATAPHTYVNPVAASSETAALLFQWDQQWVGSYASGSPEFCMGLAPPDTIFGSTRPPPSDIYGTSRPVAAITPSADSTGAAVGAITTETPVADAPTASTTAPAPATISSTATPAITLLAATSPVVAAATNAAPSTTNADTTEGRSQGWISGHHGDLVPPACSSTLSTNPAGNLSTGRVSGPIPVTPTNKKMPAVPRVPRKPVSSVKTGSPGTPSAAAGSSGSSGSPGAPVPSRSQSRVVSGSSDQTCVDLSEQVVDSADSKRNKGKEVITGDKDRFSNDKERLMKLKMKSFSGSMFECDARDFVRQFEWMVDRYVGKNLADIDFNLLYTYFRLLLVDCPLPRSSKLGSWTALREWFIGEYSVFATEYMHRMYYMGQISKQHIKNGDIFGYLNQILKLTARTVDFTAEDKRHICDTLRHHVPKEFHHLIIHREDITSTVECLNTGLKRANVVRVISRISAFLRPLESDLFTFENPSLEYGYDSDNSEAPSIRRKESRATLYGSRAVANSQHHRLKVNGDLTIRISMANKTQGSRPTLESGL